jgi:hypothetical protein
LTTLSTGDDAEWCLRVARRSESARRINHSLTIGSPITVRIAYFVRSSSCVIEPQHDSIISAA